MIYDEELMFLYLLEKLQTYKRTLKSSFFY